MLKSPGPVIICITAYLTCCHCSDFALFSYDSNFDNKICDGGEVVFQLDLSWTTLCAYQCTRYVLCKSVFIGSGQCTGCQNVYTDPGSVSLSSSTGTKLYNKQGGTVTAVVPTCVGVPTGTMLQDPAKCSSYYLCNFGNSIPQSCGSGTVFDPVLNNCNFVGSVPSCSCETCTPGA